MYNWNNADDLSLKANRKDREDYSPNDNDGLVNSSIKEDIHS
jgi:hypothetical protein